MDEEQIEIDEQTLNPLEYRPDLQADVRERTAWDLIEESEEEQAPHHKDAPSIGQGEISETISNLEETKEKLIQQIRDIQKSLERDEVYIDESNAPYIEEAKKELGLKEGPLSVGDYIHALKDTSSAGTYLVDYIEKWSEGVDGNIQWELLPELVELSVELELIDKYIDQILYSIIDFKKDGEDWQEQLLQQEKQWGRELGKVSTTQYEKREAYKEALLHSPQLILSTRGGLHESEKDYNTKRFEYNQINNALTVVRAKQADSEVIINSVSYLIEEDLVMEETETDITKLVETLPEELKNYEHMQILLHLAVDSDNEAKGKMKNTLRTVYSIPTQDRLLDELSSHQEVYRQDTLPMIHYLRGYQSDVGEQASNVFSKLTQGMVENDRNRQDKMHQFFLSNQETSRLRKEKVLNVKEKEISRQAYQLAKKKHEEGQE